VREHNKVLTSNNVNIVQTNLYLLRSEEIDVIHGLNTSAEIYNMMDINRLRPSSIHIISSDCKSIPTRFKRNEKRLPLDYDKYLIGRSYELFKNAIRSDKSLQLYKQNLFHFCESIKMTTEEIVSKYSGSENASESIKLQHMIEDYAILLQSKFRKGKISALNTDYSKPAFFGLIYTCCHGIDIHTFSLFLNHQWFLL
jgi:hypothetical protein